MSARIFALIASTPATSSTSTPSRRSLIWVISSLSTNVSKALVVITNPGGTGMPAAVMVTNEAPLPPRFSSFGSMPSSKCSINVFVMVLGLIPGHMDVFGDSHRNIVAKRDARWLIQFQGGDGSGEFFECDLGLELCQHIAQAVVDTEPKGQMLASITSGDVEGFTIFEPPFVTVGRSHQQQQFCAFRDRHAADFGSFKCFATPSDNRARVSQDFVDGFGNLFGFFHDGVPLVAVVEQYANRIRNQRCGGLVARKEQGVQQRGDLMIVNLGTVLLITHHVSGQVIPTFFVSVSDQFAAP